jgi:hypothetical protein
MREVDGDNVESPLCEPDCMASGPASQITERTGLAESFVDDVSIGLKERMSREVGVLLDR